MPEDPPRPGSAATEVDEEYDGPAHLVVDGRGIDVHARLSGRFEPVSGRYQWAGRLRPGDELGHAVRPHISVRLQTPDGFAAEATIREQDPWGGFRISGEGRPPFAVPREHA